MSIKLHNLKKAVESLNSAFFELNENPKSTLMRDGVIQRFEYTYEAAWKLIKRYLEEEMGDTLVDALNKNDLFRRAVEVGIIQNPEGWFNYHRDRNLTFHTYEESNAEKVFETAKLFLIDVKYLLSELERRLNVA